MGGRIWKAKLNCRLCGKVFETSKSNRRYCRDPCTPVIAYKRNTTIGVTRKCRSCQTWLTMRVMKNRKTKQIKFWCEGCKIHNYANLDKVKKTK